MFFELVIALNKFVSLNKLIWTATQRFFYKLSVALSRHKQSRSFSALDRFRYLLNAENPGFFWRKVIFNVVTNDQEFLCLRLIIYSFIGLLLIPILHCDGFILKFSQILCGIPFVMTL